MNEAALNATRRGADAIEASDFSAAFDKVVLGDPREARLIARRETSRRDRTSRVTPSSRISRRTPSRSGA